jgi:hypothetical protein
MWEANVGAEIRDRFATAGSRNLLAGLSTADASIVAAAETNRIELTGTRRLSPRSLAALQAALTSESDMPSLHS